MTYRKKKGPLSSLHKSRISASIKKWHSINKRNHIPRTEEIKAQISKTMTGRTYKITTDEEIKELVESIESGIPLKAVAMFFNCSIQTVLKRYNSHLLKKEI